MRRLFFARHPAFVSLLALAVPGDLTWAQSTAPPASSTSTGAASAGNTGVATAAPPAQFAPDANSTVGTVPPGTGVPEPGTVPMPSLGADAGSSVAQSPFTNPGSPTFSSGGTTTNPFGTNGQLSGNAAGTVPPDGLNPVPFGTEPKAAPSPLGLNPGN